MYPAGPAQKSPALALQKMADEHHRSALVLGAEAT